MQGGFCKEEEYRGLTSILPYFIQLPVQSPIQLPFIITYITTLRPLYSSLIDSTDIDELLLFLLASKNLLEPIRTGQSGQEYITELLSSAYPDRVFQVLYIQLSTFNSL